MSVHRLQSARASCAPHGKRYCVRCDPTCPAEAAEEDLDQWQEQTDHLAKAFDEAAEVELPGGLIIRRAR